MAITNLSTTLTTTGNQGTAGDYSSAGTSTFQISYSNISYTPSTTNAYVNAFGAELRLFVNGVRIYRLSTDTEGNDTALTTLQKNRLDALNTLESTQPWTIDTANNRIQINKDHDAWGDTDTNNCGYPGLAAWYIVKVVRIKSDKTTLTTDFQNASVLTEAQLDNAFLETFHIAQEAFDTTEAGALTKDTDDIWNAASIRIKNVDTPTQDNDAANKAYVDGSNAVQTVAELEDEVALLGTEAMATATTGHIPVVAGKVSEITTVAGDTAEIEKVAGKETEIERLGTDAMTHTSTGYLTKLGVDAMSNATTGNIKKVADIDDEVTTVAGKDTEIDVLVNKYDGSTSATSGTNLNITQVDAVADAVANINTVATNITNVNSFANTYFGAHSNDTAVASHISTNSLTLGAGDLYYNTTSNSIESYNGSSWESMKTEVGGNTVTSAEGANLTLTTIDDHENVVINSTTGTSGNTILLPKVRATTNNHVLAMKDKTTGETEWAATQVAPTLTSFTGKLNAYELPYSTTGDTQGSADIRKIANICTRKIGNVTGANLAVGQYISGTNIPAGTTITALTTPSDDNTSNGVITISADAEAVASGTTFSIQKTPGEKSGGTLVLTGTDFGTDTSEITVQIYAASSGGSGIAATYISSLSATSCTAEWTGNEASYDGFSGNYHVELKKGSLASTRVSSSENMTGDPTISDFTVANSTSSVPVADQKLTLGTYGGPNSGGGADANTSLLLNFDRNGGTDVEDSSNTGGDGHKVTVSNDALIKSSPFGDGKSAMFFDGVDDKLSIPFHNDFNIHTNFTIEFWMYALDTTTGGLFDGRYGSGDYTFLIWDGSLIKADSSTGGYNFNGTVTLGIKQWHHIALVNNAGTASIYTNGVANGNTKAWGSSMLLSGAGSVSENMTIGSYYEGSNPFNGYIDDFRITSTAVYTSNFTVPTTRLAAITNTKLLIHSDRSGGLGDADRTNSIIVGDPDSMIHVESGHSASEMVDGAITTGSGIYFTNSLTEGAVEFDFKVPEIINKLIWNQHAASSGSTLNHHGNWSFEGSHDKSTWATAFTHSNGTLKFPLEDQSIETTHTFTNTTAYRYYRINKQDGNSTNNNPYIYSIRFYNTADSDGKASDSDKFKDFSDSGHTITPTGSYHSQGHGGIAPAMTFPASGKATGSAGMYFDGTGDKLTLPASDTWKFGTGDFTIDCWVYPTGGITGSGSASIGSVISTITYAGPGWNIMFMSDGKWDLKQATSASVHYIRAGAGYEIKQDKWQHIAGTRASGETFLYLDGVKLDVTMDDVTTYGAQDLDLDDDVPMVIGLDYYSDNTAGTGKFEGYIDSIRVTKGYAYDFSVTGVPSRIYGAAGPATTNIGTITLEGAATPAADVAFTEMASSLPAGLSLSDSGSHGAIIEGTLTAPTTDTTVNNIRIQAKAGSPPDDARVTEIAEDNHVGALTLTSKATGGSVLFGARRYHGNDTVRDINGYGFKPDLVWLKNRGVTINSALYDSIRGPLKVIHSTSDSWGGANHTTTLTSFNNDGFSLGAADETDYVNDEDDTYIAWGWKAGGAPSGNDKSANGTSTEDDIADVLDTDPGNDSYNGDTATVQSLVYVKRSVNTAGGFSITEFKNRAGTNNGSTAIPHGLGSIPDFVLIKRVSTDGGDWHVRHTSMTSNTLLGNRYAVLNTSADEEPLDGATVASSAQHVYTQAGGGTENIADAVCIMYAWKAVAEVSKFGVYTGQQNPPGTITESSPTYCGFKPRFVMIKCITTGYSWQIYDTFRDDESVNRKYIKAESTDGEYSGTATDRDIEFTSNGFKTDDYAAIGASGETYIFMAFA